MIGILMAFGAIIITFLLKGVSPLILINLPAISIVFLGTFGATIGSFGLAEFLNAPKLMGIAMKTRPNRMVEMRGMLVWFAERARREGLLALESDVDQVEDEFLKHGLQMVIDGLEPDTVEHVLDLETDGMKRRHAVGANMFAQMAGYAPTFGILGAVMGLIAVMAELDDPEKLGAGIQIAFIATLMAVGVANALFQPIAISLRGHDAEEVVEHQMILTGILAIQAGDNPRIVAQKLDTYLGPKGRAAAATAHEAGGTSGAVSEEAA